VILADTSLWIEHLRHGNSELGSLLQNNNVLAHPFVTGELACGNLANRQQILNTLEQLPQAVTASQSEVLYFIEHHQLMGCDIGYVDAHLLTSTSLCAPAKIITRDRKLETIALKLGLAASPAH